MRGGGSGGSSSLFALGRDGEHEGLGEEGLEGGLLSRLGVEGGKRERREGQ